MASRKVPKLVVKRAKATRRLKMPAELAVEEQAARSPTRRRKVTRTAIVARRAKGSLRKHAYLLIIAMCAAVVVYGVAASFAGPDEVAKSGTGEPGSGSRPGAARLPLPGGAPPDVTENGVSVRWVCVDIKKQIFKKITTGADAPTKVEVYQRVALPEGTAFVPYKPPKPTPVMPTIERDRTRRLLEGGTLPY